VIRITITSWPRRRNRTSAVFACQYQSPSQLPKQRLLHLASARRSADATSSPPMLASAVSISAQSQLNLSDGSPPLPYQLMHHRAPRTPPLAIAVVASPRAPPRRAVCTTDAPCPVTTASTVPIAPSAVETAPAPKHALTRFGSAAGRRHGRIWASAANMSHRGRRAPIHACRAIWPQAATPSKSIQPKPSNRDLGRHKRE